MNPAKLLTTSLIGVDLGGRWIKAVQLVRTLSGGPRPWRLAASLRMPRRTQGLDGGEIARLESVLHRRGFTGNRVVLAAPASRLISAPLELPPRSSGAPLDQIALAELARTSRLDPAGLEIGWWPVPPPALGSRGAESTHAIAVCCPRTEVERTLEAFDDTGLEVAAMDAPAWALARGAGAIVQAQGAGQGLCCVLDLGWSVATLVVLHEGVPVYQRVLTELGVSTLHRELRETLGVSDEVACHLIERVGVPDAEGVPSLVKGETDPWSREPDEGSRRIAEHLQKVATEVGASLAYLAHRYPSWTLDGLWCVGGGARIPGACAALSATLHTTAHAALPSLIACAPPDADEALREALEHSSIVQALGLALYPQENRT